MTGPGIIASMVPYVSFWTLWHWSQYIILFTMVILIACSRAAIQEAFRTDLPPREQAVIALRLPRLTRGLGVIAFLIGLLCACHRLIWICMDLSDLGRRDVPDWGWVFSEYVPWCVRLAAPAAYVGLGLWGLGVLQYRVFEHRIRRETGVGERGSSWTTS